MKEQNSTPLVQMTGIGKYFGSNKVLNNVNLTVNSGEVHSLVGENGAGKSTLIKILSGVYTNYEGQVSVGGEEVRFSSPLEANSAGITIIHQELSLIPSMSVTDNMFLGRQRTKHGFVKEKDQLALTKQFLANFGLDIDPNRMVERYSISIQQLIEITRAVSLDAKVIIMDEPTSALNSKDAEHLFQLIAKLKAENCAIIYVSHRMEEIEMISDRITVLRDGELIGTADTKDLSMNKIIKWMVGREIADQIPAHESVVGKEKFRVDGVTVFDQKIATKKLVDNASFSVKEGEVLGLGGLQGSGNSELLMGIFGGYNRNVTRKMSLYGKEIIVDSPTAAIDNRIVLLTNDRKANGLVISQSIIANSVMAILKKLVHYGWRDDAKERTLTKEIGSTLKFRVPSYDSDVSALSGGNQQKVVLAKWLLTKPEVLLLDEPTRGIDVGAKHEIYELINRLRETGLSIILITSEMPELLALSDRIMVMHRGEITAELESNEFSAEKVIEYAMGKKE